jgi:hypothetical protein
MSRRLRLYRRAGGVEKPTYPLEGMFGPWRRPRVSLRQKISIREHRLDLQAFPPGESCSSQTVICEWIKEGRSSLAGLGLNTMKWPSPGISKGIESLEFSMSVDYF